jgi:hypothetical protein
MQRHFFHANTQAEVEQLHLPTHLAGFSVPDWGTTCYLARLASVLETGPDVRTAIASWDAATNAATVDEASAHDLVEAAQVAAALSVTLSADGTRNGPTAGELRPPCPTRHLLRGYLDQMSNTKFARLLTQYTHADPADHIAARNATPLRSASGPIAGRDFVARLDWQAAFPTTHSKQQHAFVSASSCPCPRRSARIRHRSLNPAAQYWTRSAITRAPAQPALS